ncbi:alkaline phosphatase family protein [Compostimonas suwonensis]|uniref:phospholipase C n=1 Tax=Compostimonas suwonensis TaxID=1048394 RepID=A0A2M9BZQ4_9MICO|nr:alkaline phosphatase family protein [Compostimonas suwonensis]PJJ63556.1 phospholipase C [Compostimonas suwonensis]
MTEQTSTPEESAQPAEPPQPAEQTEPAGASRRAFLKAGGIAAAGVVVGGVAGGAIGAAIGHRAGLEDGSEEFVAMDARSEPGFDHVVTLMFENRSFDNLLGFLYDADSLPEGQSFDGLSFGDYSNTAPDGTVIPAHVYEGPTDTVMRQPSPDPGEVYPHVNTQLFGIIDPPSNADLYDNPMSEPFNAPKRGQQATMEGFVEDYRVNYRRLKKGQEPTTDELRTVMGGFSPDMLPVLSTLARNFAVYDNWHCAVPSQTFCNRSFFHAGTSHSFVSNEQHGGYDKWLDPSLSGTPTIFNRLEDKKVSWRVYFDELQLVSFTGVLHAPVLERYWRTEHFATMDRFYKDVEEGTLPAYAFIEPRLVYNHNDMHPPVGRVHESDVDGEEVVNSAVSDVRAGETLLHEVYSAIRRSSSQKGSNAMNTMLLVTFDEHGGTYDHVPPPDGLPPGDGEPGEMGFRFERLGARVPAIAISAYTKAGTIINDEMHHAALIATLTRLHGLEPLTKRDAGANDLFNAINLTTPRQPVDWPHTTPQYLPPNPEADAPHPGDAHADDPLSPPAKGLLGLLLAKYGPPDAPEPETFADAYNHLREYGNELFGAP